MKPKIDRRMRNTKARKLENMKKLFKNFSCFPPFVPSCSHRVLKVNATRETIPAPQWRISPLGRWNGVGMQKGVISMSVVG